MDFGLFHWFTNKSFKFSACVLVTLHTCDYIQWHTWIRSIIFSCNGNYVTFINMI